MHLAHDTKCLSPLRTEGLHLRFVTYLSATLIRAKPRLLRAEEPKGGVRACEIPPGRDHKSQGIVRPLLRNSTSARAEGLEQSSQLLTLLVDAQ